jgi:hypothetical protein
MEDKISRFWLDDWISERQTLSVLQFRGVDAMDKIDPSNGSIKAKKSLFELIN